MTAKGMFGFLATSFAAGIGGLSPWLGPLIDLNLISDFFQPALNVAATEVAVMGSYGAYAMWRRISQEKKRRRLLWFSVAAIACFIICLLLTNVVGILWAPGRVLTSFIWATWMLIYLGMFTFIGMVLSCIAMLLAKEAEANPQE